MIDGDESLNKIRLRATRAMNHEYFKHRFLNFDKGVVGSVVKTKHPLIIENVVKEPRFKEKEMAKRLNLVSMIGVPLKIKNGEVIGAFNCFTTTARQFTEEEINVIANIADQAAETIMNMMRVVKSKAIQEELEARKLVRRAEDALIRRHDMKREEAYSWLQ